jgi:hypothetical protein
MLVRVVNLHELDDRIAQRDQIIAEKDVAIADLQAVVQTGKLNPAVERWLAEEEVRTALEKRDRAYRSRDFAFATLWRLAKLHHPDDHHAGRCSCGPPRGHMQRTAGHLPGARHASPVGRDPTRAASRPAQTWASR